LISTIRRSHAFTLVGGVQYHIQKLVSCIPFCSLLLFDETALCVNSPLLTFSQRATNTCSNESNRSPDLSLWPRSAGCRPASSSRLCIVSSTTASRVEAMQCSKPTSLRSSTQPCRRRCIRFHCALMPGCGHIVIVRSARIVHPRTIYLRLPDSGHRHGY
jgi:hypothetical protein